MRPVLYNAQHLISIINEEKVKKVEREREREKVTILLSSKW